MLGIIRQHFESRSLTRSKFLMALLVMALTGDMIHRANNGNPSIVNYVMFCAVFAMLSLLYLIPSAIKESLTITPILPVALDVLNALFWFCGAVALAAKLGVHSCGNDVRRRYWKA